MIRLEALHFIEANDSRGVTGELSTYHGSMTVASEVTSGWIAHAIALAKALAVLKDSDTHVLARLSSMSPKKKVKMSARFRECAPCA